VSHSVCRPPYLLVDKQPAIRMETFHAVVSGANEVLYDTKTGEAYANDLPGVVEDLKKSLDEWRKRTGITAP